MRASSTFIARLLSHPSPSNSAAHRFPRRSFLSSPSPRVSLCMHDSLRSVPFPARIGTHEYLPASRQPDPQRAVAGEAVGGDDRSTPTPSCSGGAGGWRRSQHAPLSVSSLGAVSPLFPAWWWTTPSLTLHRPREGSSGHATPSMSPCAPHATTGSSRSMTTSTSPTDFLMMSVA